MPGLILLCMDTFIDHLIALLQDLKNMDKARLKQEFRELLYYINRQFFSQIPGISAIAGIVAGSWVASTFTTSPIKGLLSSWGILKGGTHVVSSTTYSFLAIFFPVIATAVVAYIVQKALKAYREKRLARDKEWVSRLEEETQAEIKNRLEILNKAKEAELLSEREFHTKLAALYQSYSRMSPSKFTLFVINKISD